METKNRNGKKLQFWVSDNEYEHLANLATASGWNMSQFIRSLIYKQLQINGANDGVDFIRKNIRDEIRVQLNAQIERLVKIKIKIGMIELSTFFYLRAVLKLTNPALEAELWEEAHREAAAYLGMRNSRAADEAFRDFMENHSIDYDDLK